MRLRDSIALTLPSFLLRLVLGVTFIWAGTGKLIGTMQVSGDDAARLANLGVDLNPIQQIEPAPVESQPDEIIDLLPTDPPETTPDELQEQADDIVETIEDALDNVPADQPTELPVIDEPEINEPVTDEPEIESGTIGVRTNPAYAWTHVQNTSGDRIASDFPEPMECQRVFSIALMISKASDPGLTADSQPITPIMPSKLASRPWPKLLAWTAAITEIVAGAFLIVGLLTRLSALSTFFVMLVAMWMTQFGPAAFHTTDAILGFIPRADDLFSPAAYAQLFWQLALASMSLAVV